ncbi:hypothetical protein N7478_012381 [Penicillium angulare]|uniref:uncharacterized protein n=1 Tax=Penicillium angulare TaxID=116970 RepID=UPI0025416014|nr:uncharacterized protein N7478_012381 [Penicillium angulare]KAJ5259400.1 hypothetical protein N7478_012381 [Penicillium angulare]
MRERANKIETLKRQLKTYEDLNLHVTPDEESTYQEQSSNLSMISPGKRSVGGCCSTQQDIPSETSSKDRYLPFPNDPQFSYMQSQVCPAPKEQQSTNTLRPSSRQRMEFGAPTDNQRSIAEPPTPVSSLQLDKISKSEGILALNSTGLSPTAYEDFALDMAELANKCLKSTSLLHMAVAGNHLDTVKVLLQDERVMIDEEDSEGFTPLQRAVMHGRSEIVKLLLEFRANPGPVRGGNLPLETDGRFRTNFSGL